MELSDYTTLSDKQLRSLLRLLQPRIREFKKSEIILSKKANEESLFLLLKGTAYLCVENGYSGKQLLDFRTRGQLIWQEMLPSPHDGHCYIQAKQACSVAYLQYEEFLLPDKQSKMPDLPKLLLGMLRAAVAARNEHCHMLQQKSLRGKLLAFLYCQSRHQPGASLKGQAQTIHIPIPYSDLADYLNVDRSALMTELRRMHEDGIIEKKAHDIKLLSSRA